MTEIETLGAQLVELCRQGKSLEAVETLYAEDVLSLEAQEGAGPQRVQGIAAVREKNRRFEQMMEVHEAGCEGPYPHGDRRFAVVFDYDVTHRESGRRMRMKEVGVYTVDGGKIAQEEFFYSE